jgi:NAD(P)-dependent dehydrogenase (short-subunit alcohol dehydrogenase family)
MDMQGRVALVTGGASGLGLATVHALLKVGASAVIVDLPDSPGLSVAADLSDRVTFAPADVRDEDAVSRAVAQAGKIGELRAVINCAGTGASARTVGRSGPFPLELFRRIVEINLIGTFNVLRLAATEIAKFDPVDGERGVIINTASAAAFDGQIGQAAYAASKAGIAGMTLPIARDLGSMMIRVVTIAPGLFDTPLMAQMPEQEKLALGALAPHPSRLGYPSEFGALAAHIISNPFLNGETIRLDGAIRMPAR